MVAVEINDLPLVLTGWPPCIGPRHGRHGLFYPKPARFGGGEGGSEYRVTLLGSALGVPNFRRPPFR